MNVFRRAVRPMLFLAIASLAAAATPLNNVVSDRAAIILSIHDVPSLVTEWNRSPWAKTWNDEQVKRYLAPMRAQMKADDWDSLVKTKTGYSIAELLSFSTGDAIIAVPDFDFAQTTPAKTSQVLVGVEVGNNAAKLETLFAKGIKDENATEETSDFSGVTVHIIHPASKSADKPSVPTVWAVVEGKWFLSPSKDAILAAIDAVHKGGVDNAWGRSERWARLQKRTGDSNVIAAINVEAIYPLLKTSLDTRLKADATAAGPFSIDAQTLLTALGLDTWREAYFTAKLRAEATDFHGGLTYSEARGLTKLLAYHDGPVPTPNFIPSKWTSVSSSKLSLKESFDSLEQILESFSPALSGMVQGQLRSFDKQLGIDLKRDLFGSLGDTVIVARTPAPSANDKDPASLAELDQFFAFSLQNPDTFSTAILAFRQLLGPQADTMFKTRDFLGQKIVTFEAAHGEGVQAGKAINYAISKGYFFLSIGSAAPVEAALRGATESQASLWTNPDVAAALAQMPSTASAFQYENINAMVGSFFKSLSDASALINRTRPTAAPSANADSNADTPPVPVTPSTSLTVDVSAQPDLEAIAKYWGYGWGYVVRDSSGIHTTSQIVYPK